MLVPVAGPTENGSAKTIPMKKRKAVLAQRYIDKNANKISALATSICSGNKSTFNDYEILIGPVPEEI